ncbi:GNAT family N-acetyltransferase [Paenibacillus paeoniae]|uniref:GNAT family N-acetyltransferase n=1 Tax=Paenibacillus paeoniae TaxID=2292705 RepID=A0A371PKK0_9BACL|nr:GNAT family N-acetyltransferase [Paenibacillus paeoniae]REK76720.1 GNAT family N-acetyltransferase [Paenibacillus paeoniae]
MREYLRIEDYKNDNVYRESFNDLAKLVFGLDFSAWYEQGCWNDQYICYSYVDNGKVIANASVNKMVVVSHGVKYNTLQIGTVMTHPDYRNQGLSGKLLRYILELYEQEFDFIYLFVNESVQEYYPRFGFERVIESRFSVSVKKLERSSEQLSTPRRMDIQSSKDSRILSSFASERVPVSSKLGIIDNEHLLMFYFVLIFPEDIYYFEEFEAIVLFKHEEDQLHIFDIISLKSIAIDTILPSLISDQTETIHFHFTPDYDLNKLQVESITDEDDTLFVRPSWPLKDKHLLFPATSHA